MPVVDGIQLPTIHLNGSGFKNLRSQLRSQTHALMQALEAMRRATPHPRDMLLERDPEAAYQLALAQHKDRMARVQSAHDELENMLLEFCRLNPKSY